MKKKRRADIEREAREFALRVTQIEGFVTAFTGMVGYLMVTHFTQIPDLHGQTVLRYVCLLVALFGTLVVDIPDYETNFFDDID